MAIYSNGLLYVEEARDLADKIQRIDNIIMGLELAMTQTAATGIISEYSLDDGQTKIRTVYKDSAGMAAGIQGWERVKQRYVNRLQGRVMRLVDSKNFIR